MGDCVTAGEAMVDILSASGRIVAVAPGQETRLGHASGALDGESWEALYTLASRRRIAALFTAPGPDPLVAPLDLRLADGGALSVTAVAERLEDGGGPCLRLTKWPRGGMLDDVARLAEENEVLSGIVATSDDAGWCMEWTDPVDLSAPEHEIVRQVFENGPRWRFCNAAMARLYRTPEGSDFNERPVAETFPRTAENEDFIRRLIRADFDLNGTPSRDLRYDGVFIEVENDVRGHIRGNRLYRMWGAVRDVSKHARRNTALREEIGALQAVLAALPDAVLVVDRSGSVLLANPAAEELAGLAQEALAARCFADLLETRAGLDELFETAGGMGGQPLPFPATLPRPEGPVRVEATARRFDLRGDDCLALCLRPQRRVPAMTLASVNAARER